MRAGGVAVSPPWTRWWRAWATALVLLGVTALAVALLGGDRPEPARLVARQPTAALISERPRVLRVDDPDRGATCWVVEDGAGYPSTISCLKRESP